MGLGARLRNSFLAGLLLLAPLAVTVFVLTFVLSRVQAAIRPVVRAVRPTLAATLNYAGDLALASQLVALGLILGAVTLLGYVASREFGRRLFGGFERGVKLFPLVRTVYFGVRQVSESLVERSAGYESVVLVEFPRTGVYSIGFVTNDSPGPARRATGEDLYNVFLPNSPNPTAGSLVMVPAADIHEVDMPVRRGIRLLVTTGLSVDDVEELPGEVAGK